MPDESYEGFKKQWGIGESPVATSVPQPAPVAEAKPSAPAAVESSSYDDFKKQWGIGVAPPQSTPPPSAPVQPEPPDFTKHLQDNRHLDFVDRALRPEKYGVINNEDGSVSSHLMSSADNIAYPNIVRKPGEDQLTKLSPDDAYKYATESGQHIKFKTPEEADQFASGGYKTAAEKLRGQTSAAPDRSPFGGPARQALGVVPEGAPAAPVSQPQPEAPGIISDIGTGLKTGAKMGLVDLAQRAARSIDPSIGMGGMEVPPPEERAKASGDRLIKEMFPQGVPKPAGLAGEVAQGLAESWPALLALGSLSPFGSIPAFAAWGLTEEHPVEGAVKGAVLGTALAGLGKATAPIANPVARWFAKIGGAATIGGGATALQGGGAKDISRDALIFGIFEVYGLAKSGEYRDFFKQKGVPEADIKTLENKDVYSPEFVEAMNEAATKVIEKSDFSKAPEVQKLTPEQQHEAIFGDRFADSPPKADAIRSLVPELGSHEWAERFYELYEKADAATALKEFPELSSLATEQQKAAAITPAEREKAKTPTPEEHPSVQNNPMGASGDYSTNVEAAKAKEATSDVAKNATTPAGPMGTSGGESETNATAKPVAPAPEATEPKPGVTPSPEPAAAEPATSKPKRNAFGGLSTQPVGREGKVAGEALDASKGGTPGAEVKGKEPWEMTKAEFETGIKGNIKPLGKSEIAVELPDGQRLRFDDRPNRDPVDHARRLIVKEALAEAKPVPPEVLADYPDLAEKYGKAAPSDATAKVQQVASENVPAAGGGVGSEKQTGRRTSEQMWKDQRESRFQDTLKLSADSPEQLRPSDINRVVQEADDQGYGKEFVDWLRQQPLNPRTKERLDNNIMLGGKLIAERIAPASAEPATGKGGEAWFENIPEEMKGVLPNVTYEKGRFLTEKIEQLPKEVKANIIKHLIDTKYPPAYEAGTETKLIERYAKEVAAQSAPTKYSVKEGEQGNPGGGRQFSVKEGETFQEFQQKPLTRVVGEDFDNTFLHGTAVKNIKTLSQLDRPQGSKKPRSKNELFNLMIPPELNEFGAQLLLSEPRQAHQASIFAEGPGQGMAVVKVKSGTKMLDLSDEASRAGSMGFKGEPRYLRFFRKPVITDDFTNWYLKQVSDGYKERNPDWREKITSQMDPTSPNFWVDSWKDNLAKYAKDKGYDLIRFADETLVLDRGVIESARAATEDEWKTAKESQQYRPSETEQSLFYDKPTGAYQEAWEAQTKNLEPKQRRLFMTSEAAPEGQATWGKADIQKMYGPDVKVTESTVFPGMFQADFPGGVRGKIEKDGAITFDPESLQKGGRGRELNPDQYIAGEFYKTGTLSQDYMARIASGEGLDTVYHEGMGHPIVEIFAYSREVKALLRDRTTEVNAAIEKWKQGNPGETLTSEIRDGIGKEVLADLLAKDHLGFIQSGGKVGDPALRTIWQRAVDFFRRLLDKINPSWESVQRQIRSGEMTAREPAGRDAFGGRKYRVREEGEGREGPGNTLLNAGGFVKSGVFKAAKNSQDVLDGLKHAFAPGTLSKAHREAAVVAGSHLGELHGVAEQANAEARPQRRVFDKLGVGNPRTPLEQNPGPQFMSDMSQGRTVAPELQPAADMMNRGWAKQAAKLTDLGVLKTVRENYFGMIWERESRRAFNQAMGEAVAEGRGTEATEGNVGGEVMDLNRWSDADKGWVKSRVQELLQSGGGKDEGGAAFFSKRPLHGQQSFLKEKVFDDVMTGIEFGLKPKSNNPVDIYLMKMAEMNTSIFAHSSMQEWRTKGDVIDVGLSGRPLKKELQADFDRGEWAKINDKYGTIWRMNPETHLMEKVGERWAKKPVADVLNNYLADSLYRNPFIGKAFKGLMATGNMLNQFQLMSGFHGGFISAESQINSGAQVLQDVYRLATGQGTLGNLGDSLKRYPQAMIRFATEGNQILAERANPSINIPTDVPIRSLPDSPAHQIAFIAKAAEMAGGGFVMDQRFKTHQTDKFFREWYGGQKLKAVLRSPVVLTEYMMKPIMEIMVPRSKAVVFGDKVRRILEQNPDATMQDLRGDFRSAWNGTDATMGQVRYDRLFMRDGAKNAIQALLRAPGWTGGTLAWVGGAPIDAVKFVSEWARTGKAPKNLPDRVAYTLSLLGTMALANGLLTWAFTGKRPEGNPLTSMDWWAFKNGETDSKGRPVRYLLPAYTKDIFAWAQGPMHTAVAKTHPLWGMIGELAQNKDYYNNQIIDPLGTQGDQALDMGKFVLKQYIPFGFRGTMQLMEGEQGKKTPLTQYLAPQVGIMPPPRAYTNSPAMNVIEEYNKLHRASITTKETTEQKKLKNDLRQLAASQDTTGFEDRASQAVEAGEITRQQVKEIVKESQEPAGLSRFTKLPMQWKLRAMKAASDYEKEQWTPHLLKSLMTEKPENLVKNRDALVSTLDEMGYSEAASIIQSMEIPEQKGKMDLTGLGVKKEQGEMGSMSEVDAALQESLAASLQKLTGESGRKRNAFGGLPSLTRKKKSNPADVLGLNL